MQSDICGATNGCGNAAEHEELTFTFRLWLRDLTALLLYVGEGGEGEGGVALLQTPAVFEQRTTTCLKISRVESTTTAGCHLCPPHTKLLSMLHAAASCCIPTPMPTYTYREWSHAAPAWGWLAHGQPILVSRRSEEGVQATATLLLRAPHCHYLSHRGTMPELRGSRLGERNYLSKECGSRHETTHTHAQCEPGHGAEEIRHFPY